MPHAWEAYGQKKKELLYQYRPLLVKQLRHLLYWLLCKKITVKYTHTVLLLRISTSGPRQFCHVFFSFHIHMLQAKD